MIGNRPHTHRSEHVDRPFPATRLPLRAASPFRDSGYPFLALRPVLPVLPANAPLGGTINWADWDVACWPREGLG